MKTERNSFKGSLGFVLAAAGSAVGLGNIWRFPYLAARDGGGLFLITYIVLALTFGFTLLTTEIAIGRKTKQSPLTAYGVLLPKAKKLGVIAWIIPVIIFPYYCVIGGWVLKYLVSYVMGQGKDMAVDGYFGGFITSQASPIVFMAIFMLITGVVVYLGVNKGIESTSKIIMPVLLVLIVAISIYSLTLSHTDDAGVTRTGLQGLGVYVIPSFEGMTLTKFFTVLMDAMGQLFYSLSVAMGIMITYGSYVSDDADIMKSINQIEIFDTIVAFLAGVMIIPAVYAFMGPEGMTSGPGLMFMSLPKVFDSMGKAGVVVGLIFFVMVLFAAITSSVSILEANVSCFMDQFKMKRSTATMTMIGIGLVMAVVVCLGYNVFYFEYKLPNGATAQILDIADYISNNILMPIVAISTCVIIGWIVKPKVIIDEATKNGEKFSRKGLYSIMVRYIAPIMLLLLFLQSIGVLEKLLKIIK